MPRRPKPPSANNGPRTDLSTVDAATMSPNAQPAYGQGTTLAAVKASAPSAPPAGIAPIPAHAPPPTTSQQTPPMAGARIHPLAPTERPNEPVTAGLPTGPGPGPEAMGLPNTATATWQTGRDAVAAMASSPNASPALQQLLASLGKGF